MMNLSPERIFAPDGKLARQLPYYEYRPSQLEYARTVRELLTSRGIALLEAQTGTGKTLGYLIPAIESRRRVIVSTGTKALQEQLYYKDIPLLHDRLGLDFEYVLMKGRQNYLCLLKYERVQMQPLLPDRESVNHFEEIQEWARDTQTGDIAEAGVPDQAPVWKQLTISAEACQGPKCRFYNQCFVFRLKKRAEEARMIVVNHHLFFADLSLQLVSGVSIFPSYDVVVFDEAHQLADIATHNLSVTFSQNAFGELFQDLLRELQILRVREKMEVGPLQAAARKVGEGVTALFDRFTTLPQRARYDNISITEIVESQPVLLGSRFVALLEGLLKHVERTEDMPQIYRRLATAQSSLGFLLQGNDPSYVYWAERNEHRQWSLQASPLDVSGLLRQSLWPNLHAAVLTSATLFLSGSAERVKQDLGIPDSTDRSFPYNFDYPAQACFYLPRRMPDPTHPGFAEAAAEQIRRLVEITQGGAFVLCTSYTNMRIYENVLRGLPYPLLIQGSKAKQTLLKSFLKKRGSVLLATLSFWQGIDIQGDSLVSVIIDKLPFAVPSDPLTEAKIQYLKKQGKNAFLEYQLPSAVMLLKQGLGRLIRTGVDYGMLAVLDPRLLTKSYGEVFLRNLPPLAIIHTLEKLETAFQERRSRFARYHK